jgi:hypothetical protein
MFVIEPIRDALVDEAGKAGITLQHLAGEVGRRATERLQRQSAEAFNTLNAAGIRRGAVTPKVVP